MQRIKLIPQDATSASKYMTLDGVVPLSQHIPTIASDFGIKEDQLTLVLASIVCPHPPIIFNDLLETEANFVVSAGIAQMPRTASTTNSGDSLISPSNMLVNGAAMPELDPNQSLLQQGVRSGAQVQVIRRKRSIMNKILGRRKSLHPSSKEKSPSSDSLAQNASPGSSSSSLASSGASLGHSDVIYNTQSRFSRSATPFLIKLVSCIEATSSACIDLFSRDYSMSFLLAYKTLLDSTERLYNEVELFGDGSALGALFRHCLACMSPKILDPIAFELAVFADFLSAAASGAGIPASTGSTQISGILSKLGTEERSFLTAWAHLCQEVASMEALNGYTSDLLGQIFAPLFISPEEVPESSADVMANRIDQRCLKITTALSYFISNPSLIGETPFKKKSKKDKRLKKNSSYIHPNASSSSTPGRERAATVTGAESEYSRSDQSTSTSTGSSSKKKDKGSSHAASRVTIAGGTYTAPSKDAQSKPTGKAASSDPKSSPGSKASTASFASDEPGSPHNLTRSETVSEGAPHEQSESDVAATNAQILTQSSNMFMVADFPWTPTMEGDLELRKGDILLVLVSDPQGWNVGRLLTAPGNPVGAFPSTYCSVITKKEVSSMLQLEDLSLFESDDASSDDSSSSVSTSSLYQHLVAARMASSSTTSPMGITSANWAGSSGAALSPPVASTSPTARQSPRSMHTTPLHSPGEPAPSVLSPKSPASTSKRAASPAPTHAAESTAMAPQPVIVDIVTRTLESPNSGSSIDSASSNTSAGRKLAASSVAIPNPSSAATFIPPLSLTGNESIVAVSGPESGGGSGRNVHALEPSPHANSSPSSGGHHGHSTPDAIGTASPGSSGSNVRSLIVSDLPRDRDIVKSYSVSTVQSRSDEIVSPANSEPIVALQPAALSATIQDIQASSGTGIGSASASPERRRRGSISRSFSQPASQHSPSKSIITPSTRHEDHKVDTSPSGSRKRASAGLGSETVQPIKLSAEAERHSKAFPVPPPKGNRHRSSVVDYGPASPGSDGSAHDRRSVPVKKLPLEAISVSGDPHNPELVSASSGDQGTSPGSTSSSLGHANTTSLDRSKPPRSFSNSVGTRGSKHRASLPDPILAPLASNGDFLNLSPRTATGEVMQMPPGSSDRNSYGIPPSSSAAGNVPRIPLSSSFRHDHSSSWASWTPQRQGQPPQSKIHRRLSGPRSPRAHDHSSLARGLSPSGSSRNSPRDRSLLGIQGAVHDEELERRTQEVHQLQGNIFALEEFNKVMQNTIAEQEMAIERLNRELELLKVAHTMALGNNTGHSRTGSNNLTGSTSGGMTPGGTNSISSNSTSGTLSRPDMETSSELPLDEQDQPKQQPPRPRKRPSRRISTIPDSALNGLPMLSSSAPGSPAAPSSPNSSSSPAMMSQTADSTLTSTTTTGTVATPALPASSTPVPPTMTPSPTPSPVPAVTAANGHSGSAAASATSPNNITIQAAALVFAIAFLLWVLQPLLSGR